MAAGASTNAGIEHGTPYNDGMEGTTTPLLADNDNDNIKDVDMPGNEPTVIIDDLDGLLEQPIPHETDSIIAKFPGMYVYAE